MRFACEASCLQCDWKATAASMKAADQAANKHARATQHSTSWHCQPEKE